MIASHYTYDIQKQALDQRQEQEITTQKIEWNALSIERKRLWAEWEQEFGPRQRQTQGSGSGSSSGDRQAPSPARPRRTFADASKNSIKKPATAKPEPKPVEKFLDAGRPLTQPDSPVKRKFEDKAAPKPDPDKPKPWRQRRSAAERKADGSYKPRQRPPKPRM
jgi:hypothetical protein